MPYLRLAVASVCKHLTVTIESHVSVRTKARSPAGTRRGLSGERTFQETWSGDDYHRDSGIWQRLERVVDRANNWYFERVVAADGTIVVEQSHPLSEHQGHGAAKYRRAR